MYSVTSQQSKVITQQDSPLNIAPTCMRLHYVPSNSLIGETVLYKDKKFLVNTLLYNSLTTI